ncbi:MAG: hypothetical protein R3F65_30085 [bacterium]
MSAGTGAASTYDSQDVNVPLPAGVTSILIGEVTVTRVAGFSDSMALMANFWPLMGDLSHSVFQSGSVTHGPQIPSGESSLTKATVPYRKVNGQLSMTAYEQSFFDSGTWDVTVKYLPLP